MPLSDRWYPPHLRTRGPLGVANESFTACSIDGMLDSMLRCSACQLEPLAFGFRPFRHERSLLFGEPRFRMKKSIRRKGHCLAADFLVDLVQLPQSLAAVVARPLRKVQMPPAVVHVRDEEP